MKYKVGDKVRVREWDDMVEEFGLFKGNIKSIGWFVEHMKKFCGQTVEINSVSSSGGEAFYRLNNCYDWNFPEKSLVPADSVPFEIKYGMVVETMDGNRYLAVNKDDELYLIGENDYFYYSPEEYNGNFENIEDESCSIKRVLQGNVSSFDCYLHNGNIALWERKETKKMTVKEISKALGYDVEVVEENG